MQDVTISDGNESMITGLQLNIKESEITALIAEDDSISRILQVVAGLRDVEEGEVIYPGLDLDSAAASPEWIQYVPDDIICYDNMKVKDYLYGIALAVSMEAAREGIRLCGVFGINPEEELLNLTFEQNRLVAMIQAIVCKPKLLLLDRPYDMLGKRSYLLLWKEIIALRKEGTTVIFSAEQYEDVVIPCDRYFFFREGASYKEYIREELPKPAKVITIEGGSMNVMNSGKQKLLYKCGKSYRFLYRDYDMGEMVLRIYKTGCSNFNVEELSMEEEIFQDYERWLQ
jgi:ABC-2 type transport system ATP-binding protein